MAAGLCYIYTAFVVFLWLFAASCLGQDYEVCPSGCSCLGGMVDCSEIGLTAIPRHIPSWTEFLDLSSNNLEDVPEGTFQKLTMLNTIDLSNNKLSTLTEDIFHNLPKLTKLTLDKNDLTQIPLLDRNSNITHLSLARNIIESISYEALLRLPYLRLLNLDFNKIGNLTNGTFPILPELHHLFLSNNKISLIEAKALSNVTSLQWLKLNKNRLEEISKNVFNNSIMLQTLELNRNRLRVLNGLIFQGLPNLTTLKLRKNYIHSLQDGCFYGLKRIQTLQLDNNNITTIKSGWLFGLGNMHQLSLSHNNISVVEEDVWTQSKIFHLVTLDMSYNGLTSVRKSTFANLRSLKNLLLDHNKISHIECESFSDLSHLQKMSMSNNEWTIEGVDATFQGLKSLTELNLNHNHLKSISKESFQGLDSLRRLHLSYNAINTIQNKAFEPLVKLELLHLNSSTLLCDCNLLWLPSWLNAAGFNQTVSALCAHPDYLQNKSIFEIKQDEFLCNGTPKPVVIDHPKEQIALKGGNATLTCVAGSSSDLMMNFQWKKDNIRILNGEVETFAKSEGESFTTWISKLHLLHVTDNDEGNYQCVVSNKLGETFSEKASVVVTVFPTFKKTPEDVTVKAGSTARLECAASGHPQPQIAWQKDGGDDFPAARDRRMHVMPTDDVFFISAVKAEDQGVYSCTAKNDAGGIVANATLKVLNKPSFVRPMHENIEVMQGRTAVLECISSGSPIPRLVWTKDGGPLELSERHFFAANDQLMIILDTNLRDSGKYTCQMKNTLGTERGTSRLVVYGPHGPSPQEGANKDETTTTGIIIIAVVCCVVGTSLVWVIIIYQTRKKTEEYSSTPTDETTLPGEMPSTPFHGSEKESSSPGLLAPHFTAAYGKYPIMAECNGGFGYSPSPHKMRSAAIFPSDIEDDDQRQSIPLTQDEQQPAEASDNSITLLRRLQPNYMADSEDSSARSSTHNSHSTRNSSGLLQTFQPHPHRGYTAPAGHPQEGDELCPTVAIVHAMPHPSGAGQQHPSNPRLAYLVDRLLPNGQQGSQPPEHESGSESDSDYYTGASTEQGSATFPRHQKPSPVHNSSFTQTVPHPPHRHQRGQASPHAQPPPPPRLPSHTANGRIPHYTEDISSQSIRSDSATLDSHNYHEPFCTHQTVRACPHKTDSSQSGSYHGDHPQCHSNSNGDISLDYRDEAPGQTLKPCNGNAIPNGTVVRSPSSDQTLVNTVPLPHRTSHPVTCK